MQPLKGSDHCAGLPVCLSGQETGRLRDVPVVYWRPKYIYIVFILLLVPVTAMLLVVLATGELRSAVTWAKRVGALHVSGPSRPAGPAYALGTSGGGAVRDTLMVSCGAHLQLAHASPGAETGRQW